jgi:hypothetical protein
VGLKNPSDSSFFMCFSLKKLAMWVVSSWCFFQMSNTKNKFGNNSTNSMNEKQYNDKNTKKKDEVKIPDFCIANEVET